MSQNFVFFYKFNDFWFYIVLIHIRLIFVQAISYRYNFILLLVFVQFSQHHLLKRLSSPYCIFLPPLSKNKIPQVHGLISGLSIFQFIYIFAFVPVPYCLDDYSFVVQSTGRQYDLKSGRLIPPVLFLFLKIALAIFNFCVPYKSQDCSIFVKNAIGIQIEFPLNLQIALHSGHFNNINSSNS